MTTQVHHSIREARKPLDGIGHTKIHQPVADGELPARKLGGRTVGLETAPNDYAARLPIAPGVGVVRPSRRHRRKPTRLVSPGVS
jgi:hypothetical protein